MITEDHIRRILRLRGDGVPILSMYARVPAGHAAPRELRSRTESLLSEIRPLASDPSIDRQIRLSLRSDIERVEKLVGGGRTWSAGTLTVFSCSAHNVFEQITLPRAVRDRIMLDETPWVRALLAVLYEYRRMCVVVIDRGRARLYELYQDELCKVAARRGRAAHPRHAPALTEERVRNKADELTKRHFRDTIERVANLFRTDGFDLLAIGGQRHETARFVGLLPGRLRNRIAGTFTVYGLPTDTTYIRQRATTILREYEQEEQRRRVAELVEKVAEGGRAALGLADCLWAGALAGIDALLVEDGAVVPGVMCDHCGWMSVRGTECAQCAGRPRPVADILDELAETVINEGGSVTHVQADTELREHLVGAWLRFDLPPPP